MRALIFICGLLLSGVSIAKTMRVCVPHDPPPQTPTANGLRALPSIDYKSLCGKNGVTCKPTKYDSIGYHKMDCFIMHASGKQLDFPEQKPDLGPENPALSKIAPIPSK